MKKFSIETISKNCLQLKSLRCFMNILGYTNISGIFVNTKKYPTNSRFISFNNAVKLHNGNFEIKGITDNKYIERVLSGELLEKIFLDELPFDIEPDKFYFALATKLVNKVALQFSKKRKEIIFQDSRNVRLMNNFLKIKYEVNEV